MDSSWTGYWTCVPCMGRWIPIHFTTREVLAWLFLNTCEITLFFFLVLAHMPVNRELFFLKCSTFYTMKSKTTVNIDESILYVLTWSEIPAILLTEISKILREKSKVLFTRHINPPWGGLPGGWGGREISLCLKKC